MEFNSATENLQSRARDVLDNYLETLPNDAAGKLDSHIDEIEGYNRGHTSTAYCDARKGPPVKPIKLRLQNNASRRVIYHELGHALADALGVDCTQEATERANNKTNYSRWPQFSFGKKDSPKERFMFRRYGATPSLPRVQIDSLEELRSSDLFWVDGDLMRTDCWKYTDEHREYKRYTDPFVYTGDEIHRVNAKYVGSRKSLRINNDPDSSTTNVSDVEMIDRYRLTPGLATIEGKEENFDDPWLELLSAVNEAWYQAVTLVRKRDDKREKGIAMSPRGARQSYYLMNAHEYFAELNAVIQVNAESDIERLEEHVPGVVTAYQQFIAEPLPLNPMG